MSEIQSGNSNMSVSSAAKLIKSRIAPVGICQSVAERIRHASRKLGWSYSRTRDVWYENARAIRYEEMKRAEEVAGLLATAKEELKDVDALLANADTLLDRKNPVVRRAIRAGLRAFLGTLSGSRTERKER